MNSIQWIPLFAGWASMFLALSALCLPNKMHDGYDHFPSAFTMRLNSQIFLARVEFAWSMPTILSLFEAFHFDKSWPGERHFGREHSGRPYGRSSCTRGIAKSVATSGGPRCPTPYDMWRGICFCRVARPVPSEPESLHFLSYSQL